MKKRMQRVFAAFLAIVLCALADCPKALAAQAPSVSVPVQISLTGTLPQQPEEFCVRLQAQNGQTPMPEGCDAGQDTLLIAGAGQKTFPAIVFEKVGIYRYTIFQEAGGNGDCTYDGTVYRLLVYVTNGEDGGLETTSILYQGSSGSEKADQAVFHNAYVTDSGPQTPQDPGDGKETGIVTSVPAISEQAPVAQAPEAGETAGSINTGDSARPALWGLMAVTAGCVIALIRMRRKKYENEEE